MNRLPTCYLTFVILTSAAVAQPPATDASANERQSSETSPTQTQAADGQLGSAMTLEMLGQTRPVPAKQQPKYYPAPVKPPFWTVDAATEPVPALRYRFWYSATDLKPTSAMLFYARAQVGYLQEWVSDQLRDELSEHWVAVCNGGTAPREDLKRWSENLTDVYAELHALALSEDRRWDHRIRDVRGPQALLYQLPDVQVVRTMARLLLIKARHQLNEKNFEGFQKTIADGFHLSRFAGGGECFIQQLVSVAVAAMMCEEVEEAIRTPGCPNLYWAIAAIPRPVVSMRRSVDWELSLPSQLLPALAEAETANWTEEQAREAWMTMVRDLNELSNGFNRNSQVTLAVAPVTFVEAARKRLRARRFSPERLSTMPDLQVVMADAAYEVRRIADNIHKATLLPYTSMQGVRDKDRAAREKWLASRGLTSLSAMIVKEVFPAHEQMLDAPHRVEATLNLLMTIEAIRMHVALHGSPPTDLQRLDPVPAMPNPFTAMHFDYTVEKVDGVEQITVTPTEQMRNFDGPIRIRFQQRRPTP